MAHKAFTLGFITLSPPKLGKIDSNNNTIIIVFTHRKAKTTGNRRPFFYFLYNTFK